MKYNYYLQWEQVKNYRRLFSGKYKKVYNKMLNGKKDPTQHVVGGKSIHSNVELGDLKRLRLTKPYPYNKM